MSVTDLQNPEDYAIIEMNGEEVLQQTAKMIALKAIPNLLIVIREAIAGTVIEMEQLVFQSEDGSLTVLVYRDPTVLIGGWNWCVMEFDTEIYSLSFLDLLQGLRSDTELMQYIKEYHNSDDVLI